MPHARLHAEISGTIDQMIHGFNGSANEKGLPILKEQILLCVGNYRD